MTDAVTLTINGKQVSVESGTVLAAAVARAGISRFRKSVLGNPRAPLCGMGICMECRVTLNGNAHVRSCQVLCADGMDVRTDL